MTVSVMAPFAAGQHLGARGVPPKKNALMEISDRYPSVSKRHASGPSQRRQDPVGHAEGRIYERSHFRAVIFNL